MKKIERRIYCDELMDRLVLGRKYQLQEIYNFIEDYFIKNNIDAWKHKDRALPEEKRGIRPLGKYQVTNHVDCALILLIKKGR